MNENKIYSAIMYYPEYYIIPQRNPGEIIPGIVMEQNLLDLVPISYVDKRFNTTMIAYNVRYTDIVYILLTDNEVPGIVPNKYYISNYGDIYDMERGCLVKQWPSEEDNPYMLTKLKTTTRGLAFVKGHRLVLMAFCPIANMNKLVPNHINNIHCDNRLINLEWSTYARNKYHAFDVGAIPDQEMEDLNVIRQVALMIEQYPCGDSKTIYEIIDRVGRDKFIAKDPYILIWGIWNRKKYAEFCKDFNFPPYQSNDKYKRNLTSEQMKAGRFSEEKVEEICQYIKDGLTDGQIANKYGYYIINGKRSEESKPYESFRRKVNSIRQKKIYKDISDKFF